MMNQELSLRWWPWGKNRKDNTQKTSDIDETLDRIAELRAQVDDDIESLRATVNGEDMWWKCYQITEDHHKRGS